MSDTIYTGTLLGTPGLRGGLALLTIDGEALDVMSDAAYDATTLTRETAVGQSGVQGFTEMPKAGFISAKVRDAGNLTVAYLKTLTAATVVLQLANGKVVNGFNMWCTECSEVSTQEGSFTVRFDGVQVVENAL